MGIDINIHDSKLITINFKKYQEIYTVVFKEEGDIKNVGAKIFNVDAIRSHSLLEIQGILAGFTSYQNSNRNSRTLKRYRRLA
jgi:hypothetical protein